MKITYEGYKFTVECKEDIIHLIALDTDMIKYANIFDDVKEFDIKYISSIDTIYDIIVSSLLQKNATTISIEKSTDAIILNIIQHSGFFEIPLQVKIPVETENDNIILERKIRKVETDKNNEIRHMHDYFEKEISLLKTQLGNVIFLSGCSTPIPMDICELALYGKEEKHNAIYERIISDKVDWTSGMQNGTDHLHLVEKMGFHFGQINACGSCSKNAKRANHCNCGSSYRAKKSFFTSVMVMQKFENHIIQYLQQIQRNLYVNDGYSYYFTGNDIAPLGLLNKLTSLRIMHNPNLKNIEGLNENLMRLDLSNCVNLKDISALSRFKNLTHIDLEGCASIDDGSPLENLENLIKVNIAGTGIKKLKLVSIGAKIQSQPQ